jgi:hypothetical protein
MTPRIDVHKRRESPEAEVLALRAASFLAADPERLVRFMDLTGIDAAALRRSLAEPAFLGGLLDHLLADETLLLMFAESQQIRPEEVVKARRQLPGAAIDI